MKKYSWGIRFSDIMATCLSPEKGECLFEEREHVLIYVRGGEMIISEDGFSTLFKAGECAFVRRDYKVSILKRCIDGLPFLSTTIVFKRKFLIDVFCNMNPNGLPQSAKRSKIGVVKIPVRPDIKSLFDSIQPYIDSGSEPPEEWIDSKLYEGLNAVLSTDPSLYASLFDFTEPWKIDIMEFMNDHYKNDLSIDDMSLFTGRSPATFKRDFKKVSQFSPVKWLIDRRLDAAHKLLLTTDMTVSDVMTDVGFKNLSHFSKCYKEKYGHSPTKKPE